MKDSIQSRREFFKNATKAILPILGCLALPSTVYALIQKDTYPQTCNGSCSGLCTTSCYNG